MNIGTLASVLVCGHEEENRTLSGLVRIAVTIMSSFSR